ncbi:MAG: hypothetical protein LBD70_05315, partial [Bifidobacteriaceae bacterium]|nr:hypothetical protein [Bifidobacteriaceae bacterium]
LGPPPPAATRRQIAAAAPAAARGLIAALAARSDAAAFAARAPARREAEDYWQAVAQAEQAVKRGLGAWRRLRGRLAIRFRRPKTRQGRPALAR